MARLVVFGYILEKKNNSLNNLKIVKTMHERKMEMFMQDLKSVGQ